MPKDEITDFYAKMPKEFVKKHHNPCYSDHRISVPFRMLIVGGSGSGKTSIFLNLLQKMKNTFDLLVLCVKSADEPLYKLLLSKLKKDQYVVFEGGKNVPPVSSFQNVEGQILAVFDDLILERDQANIVEYFVRGRKVGGGISSVYITQSYYKTPKEIRLNVNYLILKKLASERDLKMILSEFSLGLTKEELMYKYKQCTRTQKDSMLVDLDAPAEERYRCNFREVV